MADKKEIIIDGVDVSECEYRDWRNSCHCDNSKENEGEERITGNPNCHFKQLKRKEREIINLKEVARIDIENLNQACFDLKTEIEERIQECEELKKEKAEIKKYLGISSKTIMQRLEELQERKDKLSVRECNYKQALDEIEYQIKELFLGVENKDRPFCERILDIINQVKE